MITASPAHFSRSIDISGISKISGMSRASLDAAALARRACDNTQGSAP